MSVVVDRLMRETEGRVEQGTPLLDAAGLGLRENFDAIPDDLLGLLARAGRRVVAEHGWPQRIPHTWPDECPATIAALIAGEAAVQDLTPTDFVCLSTIGLARLVEMKHFVHEHRHEIRDRVERKIGRLVVFTDADGNVVDEDDPRAFGWRVAPTEGES